MSLLRLSCGHLSGHSQIATLAIRSLGPTLVLIGHAKAECSSHLMLAIKRWVLLAQQQCKNTPSAQNLPLLVVVLLSF